MAGATTTSLDRGARRSAGASCRNQDQEHAGEEAADVGEVGHAAALRGHVGDGADAREELQADEPEQQQQPGGELEAEQDNEPADGGDARVGELDQVGAHDAEDGAAGADLGMRLSGADGVLPQPPRGPAEQVEEQEPAMAEEVFRWLAEKTLGRHVADDVHQPA